MKELKKISVKKNEKIRKECFSLSQDELIVIKGGSTPRSGCDKYGNYIAASDAAS